MKTIDRRQTHQLADLPFTHLYFSLVSNLCLEIF